jgi:hypothetical protein
MLLVAQGVLAHPAFAGEHEDFLADLAEPLLQPFLGGFALRGTGLSRRSPRLGYTVRTSDGDGFGR